MSKKHLGVSLEVIERDENQIATTWLAACDCGERFAASTYELTEDKWRRHQHEITGKASKPMGSKAGRWTP